MRPPPRLHTVLTYSPGFTFYQRMSSLDQVNQNFGVSLQYRLSPHVTLSLGDTFQKTFRRLEPAGLALSDASFWLSPGLRASLVIAPVADQLRNIGNAELTYQFSANSMIGASGTFNNLHYPNSAQVPGLFDSSSAGDLRSTLFVCREDITLARLISTRELWPIRWGRRTKLKLRPFPVSTRST